MNTRDEVLRKFGYCGWCEAGICSGDDNKTASHNMADEIVRLREQLAEVARERDALKQELYQALDLNGGDNGLNASWTYAELWEKERSRAERMEQVCLMAQLLTSVENPSWLTYGDWADFRAAVTAMDKEM